MSTVRDYDARRDVETMDRSAIRELALSKSSTAVVDEDPSDAGVYRLPDADVSGEELSASVIPQRADEFTCSCCFLVQHRSRLRISHSGRAICADCA